MPNQTSDFRLYTHSCCAVVSNPFEMSMLMEMIRAHIHLCFMACTPSCIPHNHDVGGLELWLRRERTYIPKGTHLSI